MGFDTTSITFEEKKIYTNLHEIYRNAESGTTVYEALDQTLNRIVIIKRIRYQNKAHREIIFKEVKNQVVLETKTSNIPTIYEVKEDCEEHCVYIVMQKMVGRSLREIMDTDFAKNQNSPDRYSSKYEILEMICRTMSEIHSLQGFVHKDLKPENIIINRERMAAYIIDFGISGLGMSKGVGTAAYMAPEQKRANREFYVDQASDVFAIAQIAIEMFTGAPLKEGTDLVGKIGETHWLKQPDLSGIGGSEYPNLGKVLTKAIERSPKGRYRNAIEMRRELRKKKEYGRLRKNNSGSAGRGR